MRLCCVCTGNTCRSPMLERLLQAAVGDRVEVMSAGIAAAPGQPAADHAITCLAERGLDLSDHQSRAIDSLDLDRIDRFICMGDRHAAALEALGVPANRVTVANDQGGGVPDPFGMGLEVYQATAAVLAEVAQITAAEIAADGGAPSP